MCCVVVIEINGFMYFINIVLCYFIGFMYIDSDKFCYVVFKCICCLIKYFSVFVYIVFRLCFKFSFGFI